jgi:ATP-dependent RNA helicase DeaD
MNFNLLALQPNIMRAIEDASYTQATDIQAQAIPVMLDGHDIIGQSHTGTGKTAAFVLPILSMLNKAHDKRLPQALILCPTRELAIQITTQIRMFSKYMENVKTVTIYGGQPISTQIFQLKGGVDIVVGTPGRVLDHMRRKTLRFEQTRFLVLDEADEMLQMGFKEELEDILKELPKERQTVLFSATMPKAILDITKQYQNKPKHIQIAKDTRTVTNIQQLQYEVQSEHKDELLVQVLNMYKPNQALVFANTKKMVDDLNDVLNQAGFSVAALHGDMKQDMRTSIMAKFKLGHVKIMIATDVAARGIDVNHLDMVINYDLPQDDEYYIHRIGRTGRASATGTAITLISPKQKRSWARLVQTHKLNVASMPYPTQEELDFLTTSSIMDKLQSTEMKPDMLELAQALLVNYDHPEALVAELLSNIVGNQKLKALKPLKQAREGNFKTYTLNVGRKHGVNPSKLVKSATDLCGIHQRYIGDIHVESDSTIINFASTVDFGQIKRLKRMLPKQNIFISVQS